MRQQIWKHLRGCTVFGVWLRYLCFVCFGEPVKKSEKGIICHSFSKSLPESIFFEVATVYYTYIYVQCICIYMYIYMYIYIIHIYIYSNFLMYKSTTINKVLHLHFGLHHCALGDCLSLWVIPILLLGMLLIPYESPIDIYII